MPNIVAQPQGSGVTPLLSEQESRHAVRVGQNKWTQEVRDQIDVTWIGGKRFYTPDAINRYLRKQTAKAPPKVRPDNRQLIASMSVRETASAAAKLRRAKLEAQKLRAAAGKGQAADTTS